MNRFMRVPTLAAALILIGAAARADDNPALPALEIPQSLQSVVPLPVAESELPSVEAKEYFKVSDKGVQLECPTFDAKGDLLFCEVFGGTVFRLTPEKQLSSFVPNRMLRPAGLAVHKEGRVYMAELGDFKSRGSVISMAPDGTVNLTKHGL